MSLERMLKDQQESHKQQLVSFLITNAALREENTTLKNGATTPHHGNLTLPCNPTRSESTDNFSPPPPWDHPLVNNPQPIQTPSLRRNLDLALRALDDMSLSPFVLTILNQEAPPHFSMQKFKMYDGVQDPFDHLRRVTTLYCVKSSHPACQALPCHGSTDWLQIQ